MGKWLLRTLDSNEDADDYFDPETAHPHLTQKLQAFSLWYNNYFSALRSFPADTTCTSPEILSVRQSKVAILAINSALFCMGADDHQKLFIGRRCLDRAKQQLLALEADLKIALMHHPLDWLSPFERSTIKAALGNSIDLLLHGHYHETGTESIVSANGGYLNLAAGAAYQKRAWPNCAMYATFYANQVSIFPIRYEDKPHEIWTLDTSVFPSPSYLGSFPIPGRAHQGSEEAAATTREDEDSVESYQAALREELGNISLLGTHALENIPVGLTETFVSLRMSDTWRSDREFSDASPAGDVHKEEYIRTSEEVTRLVFKKNRLLLIIGDPGSGKTTLLKHYAITCLQPNGYQRLGFTEPVLLFFFPLRELIPQGVTFAPLSHQLFAWSEKHHLEIAERHFASWLKRGKTLLLFDGLDEISDTEQRIKACSWIDRIVSRFTNARLVVTSRATGYRKGEGIEFASLHTRADIMDFTVAQQAEFLRKWFQAALLRELPPQTTTDERWERAQRQKALQKAETIVEFLGREGNKSLQMLARVPMLLQIMAILWKEREFLPGTRVELYDAALNYILDYRDRQKKIEPLLPAKYALYVLAPLSLWMQEVLGKDEVDGEAMRQQMQLKLNELNQKYSASAFCKNLVDRAGLLVEYRDKEYLFRHKSFREYMAALQLNAERDKGSRMTMLAGQFGNDWWEEPLRFFIGQVDADTFDSFMQKLFDSPVSAEMTQKQQDLLMTLIREARGKKITALKAKLLDPLTSLNRQRYIMQCLESIAQFEAHADNVRNVVTQFHASGFSKELPVSSESLKDMLGAEYLLIKGGTFIYSVTQESTTVPDLYVAKYTVTNRLYRQFISYLGAQEPLLAERLPLESYIKQLYALAEGMKEKGFSDYLKEGENDLASRFCSGRDDDLTFGGNDQPVVSVVWYDAKAYCLWLSLLESGGRESSRYRLPEEFEWEYAAAGVEGRNYPWPAEKGEPTSKLANYGENEGATTTVGRYPQGATPEGLCDMAGNVWEWMENWYDEKEKNRSWRGGSWRTKADALRCSSRSDYVPRSYVDYVGFRVIRSSHSSLPENLIL